MAMIWETGARGPKVVHIALTWAVHDLRQGVEGLTDTRDSMCIALAHTCHRRLGSGELCVCRITEHGKISSVYACNCGPFHVNATQHAVGVYNTTTSTKLLDDEGG